MARTASHSLGPLARRAPALALAALALAAADIVATRAQPSPLTVERIASLPSFTGTPPVDATWSPDSTRVAFLWNDSGMPFRDIWVVSASGGAPRRLTTMSDQDPSSSPPATDMSLAALRARAAWRQRGGVSDLVWTPDGRAIAFSYGGDVHRVNADGSGLTRLTRAGGGASQLAFSPDARFLSFLRGGDLWLWRTADTTLVRATKIGVPPIGAVATPGSRFHTNDVEFRSYAWSSDSTKVALEYVDRRNVRVVPFPYYLGEETMMNTARRGYPGDSDEIRRIAVYGVGDGMLRYVDLPEPTSRNIIGYEWSPDGKKLLVEQDSDEGETRWLLLVDVVDRSAGELWRDHRPRRIYSFFTSTWRSDGQAVLFIGDDDAYYRLESIPVAGGRPTALTTGAFDVAAERGAATVAVAPKTGQVFFVSSQKSPYERQVYRMPDRGGPIVQVTSLEGLHTPFVSPDGAKVAVLRTSDVSPTELYIVDAAGGTPERRITSSPPKEFSAYTWARPRYVTFKSRIDGFTLHGRLIVPPDLDPSKKYPVVIGSVYSNTVRNEWRGLNQSLQQFMAIEKKYINLQIDLRGSVGYGVAFREAFQGDWGGGDLDDIRSAVDYLKTLPYVDPDRIGIWGSSYGGMMVLFALFESPGMFKAGVAGAPAVEVARFTTGDQHLSRRPNSHPEIFRKSTLLNYGEKLQDHLLFIQGMQDDIVPFKTTVMLMEKLMTLGKDFDIAIAPASGHGWTQQEHYAVFMMRKLVEYFDRYLHPGPTHATSSSSKP